MKQENELYSFPYNEAVDGIEHNYNITQNVGTYSLKKDGLVIAELSHEIDWKQVSGEKLSKKLFESICNHIESHFD